MIDRIGELLFMFALLCVVFAVMLVVTWNGSENAGYLSAAGSSLRCSLLSTIGWLLSRIYVKQVLLHDALTNSLTNSPRRSPAPDASRGR